MAKGRTRLEARSKLLGNQQLLEEGSSRRGTGGVVDADVDWRDGVRQQGGLETGRSRRD